MPKGGGVGAGGWGKRKKVRDEAYGGKARQYLVDHVRDSINVLVCKKAHPGDISLGCF